MSGDGRMAGEQVETIVGTIVSVPIARDTVCPYLQADSVLIAHVALSHELVGLEVSILTMQNHFSHQENVVEAVEGDTATVSGGKIVGGSQLVHKATVRLSPLSALDAAAAMLEHMVKNQLVTDDAVKARLALAGLALT